MRGGAISLFCVRYVHGIFIGRGVRDNVAVLSCVGGCICQYRSNRDDGYIIPARCCRICVSSLSYRHVQDPMTVWRCSAMLSAVLAMLVPGDVVRAIDPTGSVP